MPRYAALSALTVAAVAAGLLAASPALAKDAPPTTDAQTYCTTSGVQFLPDGSQEFGVEANGAGCVVVRTLPDNGGLMLSDLVVAPGWSYQVKSFDPDRIEVRFSSSNDRAEVRIEPGKTEVK